jgi:hypothetical protein
VRLLSVALSTATVLITYLIGLEIFPKRRYMALAAAALTGFNPQYLVITSAASDYGMAAALSGLALWVMLRILRHGPSTRQMLVLGILIGLAGLTKLSGLGLLPLAALVLGLTWWRHRMPLRKLVQTGLIVFAVSGLLLAPWFLTVVTGHTEVTGTTVEYYVPGFRGILGRPQEPLPILLRNVALTYWITFNFEMFGPVPQPTYLVLTVLCLAGIGLVGVILGQPAERPRYDTSARLGLLVISLWAGIVFSILFVYYIRQAPFGRYMYLAVSSVSTLLAVGLAQWVPAARQRIVLTAVASIALGIAAISPFVFIVPVYARPARLAQADLPVNLARVDVDYDGKMRLLGYQLDRREVAPEEDLQITLYWQAITAMDENYVTFVHVFGRDGQKIAQRDSYHGLGNYPSSLWSPGEIAADRYRVSVAADAAGPVLARIEVGLYEFDTEHRLTAFDPQGNPVSTSPTIAHLKLSTRTQPVVSPSHPTDYRLGELARLVGYDLRPANPVPGDQLELTLYWEVQGRVGVDYTVFVHLLDSAGQLRSQGDSPPLGGQYPTSWWAPGERLVDRYTLTVARDAPAGRYHLGVGMYDPTSLQRLPAFDATGRRLANDLIALGPIEVTK